MLHTFVTYRVAYNTISRSQFDTEFNEGKSRRIVIKILQQNDTLDKMHARNE